MPKKPKSDMAIKRASISFRKPSLGHIKAIQKGHPELTTLTEIVAWALRIAAEKGGD